MKSYWNNWVLRSLDHVGRDGGSSSVRTTWTSFKIPFNESNQINR
jgi:hypothetical protein